MQRHFPSRRRLIPAAALLLSLAVFRTTIAAEPAVLQEIPDDAASVLIITNVKLFSARLANLGVRMNLPIPPDPMGVALRNMRIVKGFDPNGSAALVILKPLEQKAKPNEEAEAAGPSIILLLPTTDSKAMLEQWEPGDPDKGGVSEVTLPAGGLERGYVATVGKFVAFAQDHDALSQFLVKKQSLSKILPDEALKSMDRNDVVLYVNVPAIAPKALASLEKKQEELVGMLDLKNLQSGNETSSAFQKQQLNLFFEAGKEFLKDTNTALVGLRLSDAGVNLTSWGQFKQESTIGKLVKAQKPAANHIPSLVGLPGPDFAAAGAVLIESKTLAQFSDDMMTAILKDPVIAKDPRFEEFKKAAVINKQMIELIQGANYVFNLQSADPKKGQVIGAFVLDTTDSAKYLSLLTELLRNPISAETMDPDVLSTVTVTPAAITVKGVKFLKVLKKFKLREETTDRPISEDAKKSFETLVASHGTDGQVLYFGLLENKVICIVGSDATVIDNVVDAVLKKSDALSASKQITPLNAQLLPAPAFVSYISIETLLGFAQTQLTDKLRLPADKLPPAPVTTNATPGVLSVAVDGANLSTDLHLPVSTLANLVKWGMSLQQLVTGSEEELPPLPPKKDPK